MATIKTPKPLAEQITAACTRAQTAKSYVVCISFDDQGLRAKVTSSQDADTEYTITRNDNGDLACTCPACVVCKHVGLLLNQGVDYHSSAVRMEAPASAEAEVIFDLPLLLNIEAEVAEAEAFMSERGYYWSDDTQTWLKRPTFDEARDRLIASGGW